MFLARGVDIGVTRQQIRNDVWIKTHLRCERHQNFMVANVLALGEIGFEQRLFGLQAKILPLGPAHQAMRVEAVWTPCDSFKIKRDAFVLAILNEQVSHLIGPVAALV